MFFFDKWRTYTYLFAFSLLECACQSLGFLRFSSLQKVVLSYKEILQQSPIPLNKQRDIFYDECTQRSEILVQSILNRRCMQTFKDVQAMQLKVASLFSRLPKSYLKNPNALHTQDPYLRSLIPQAHLYIKVDQATHMCSRVLNLHNRIDLITPLIDARLGLKDMVKKDLWQHMKQAKHTLGYQEVPNENSSESQRQLAFDSFEQLFSSNSSLKNIA